MELRLSSTVSAFPVNTEETMTVSLPTFLRLCGKNSFSVDEIPMEKLLIKPKNFDDTTMNALRKEFQVFIDNGPNPNGK